jgi:hypothetical protein
MEGTLISLLIFVVILGVIYYILTLIPLPQPFKNIALIIIAVIALLYLVGMFTGYSPSFRR